MPPPRLIAASQALSTECRTGPTLIPIAGPKDTPAGGTVFPPQWPACPPPWGRCARPTAASVVMEPGRNWTRCRFHLSAPPRHGWHSAACGARCGPLRGPPPDPPRRSRRGAPTAVVAPSALSPETRPPWGHPPAVAPRCVQTCATVVHQGRRSARAGQLGPLVYAHDGGACAFYFRWPSFTLRAGEHRARETLTSRRARSWLRTSAGAPFARAGQPGLGWLGWSRLSTIAVRVCSFSILFS
jgi:hypothetical protein